MTNQIFIMKISWSKVKDNRGKTKKNSGDKKIEKENGIHIAQLAFFYQELAVKEYILLFVAVNND